MHLGHTHEVVCLWFPQHSQLIHPLTIRIARIMSWHWSPRVRFPDACTSVLHMVAFRQRSSMASPCDDQWGFSRHMHISLTQTCFQRAVAYSCTLRRPCAFSETHGIDRDGTRSRCTHTWTRVYVHASVHTHAHARDAPSSPGPPGMFTIGAAMGQYVSTYVRTYAHLIICMQREQDVTLLPVLCVSRARIPTSMPASSA